MIGRLVPRADSETRTAWAIVWRHLKPATGRLALFTLASVAQAALVLPIIYLVHVIFDLALPKHDNGLLMLAGAGMVAANIVRAAMSLALRKWILHFTKGVIANIRGEVTAHLYALSHEYHAGADLSRTHARVIDDTERLDNALNALFSTVIPAGITAVIMAGALLFIQWDLVLALVIIAPAMWLVTRSTSGLMRRQLLKFRADYEDYAKGSLFILRNMNLTRDRAYEAGQQGEQRARIDRLAQSGEAMGMGFAWHSQANQFLTALAATIIIVLGALHVADGSMGAGALLAFYAAIGFLGTAIGGAMRGVSDVLGATQSLKALRELFESGPLCPYTGARELPRFSGAVSLRNVSFAYGDTYVLRAVSLAVGPGKRVAIVGRNGSGKSTIINLIMGLIRPESGEVCADDVAYAELDLQLLRRDIGIVRQPATVFRGSIFANIAYGSPGASLEDAIASAKLAHAHDFISALPNGYDTAVGEDGHMLSGGECQRIAIARALLGRPKLLILDEPNNHLDVQALNGLLDTLRAGGEKFGVLLISHDARAVSFADEVYELQNGVLTAIKPHPVVVASVPSPVGS